MRRATYPGVVKFGRRQLLATNLQDQMLPVVRLCVPPLVCTLWWILYLELRFRRSRPRRKANMDVVGFFVPLSDCLGFLV